MKVHFDQKTDALYFRLDDSRLNDPFRVCFLWRDGASGLECRDRTILCMRVMHSPTGSRRLRRLRWPLDLGVPALWKH